MLFAPQNFAQALFSISLGAAVIFNRNEKQRLCQLLVGKYGALWETCKWRKYLGNIEVCEVTNDHNSNHFNVLPYIPVF